MCVYDWFSLKETEELKVPEITMSEASSEVEPLPESYFTQPVNLAKGKSNVVIIIVIKIIIIIIMIMIIIMIIIILIIFMIIIMMIIMIMI